MEEISRSGRNIKVSALSIGLLDLGTIAECIEQLFVPELKVSAQIIQLTFEALKLMPEILHDFIENKPPSEKIHELVRQLQNKETEKLLASNHGLAKKIVETFKIELHEQLVVMTNDLLQLEKRTLPKQEFQDVLKEIFRIAHTIKGSAQGIGATDLAEIAHHVEHLFEVFQNKPISFSPQLINLCLHSVDYMNEALQSYDEERPLSFDLQAHLLQLKRYIEFVGQGKETSLPEQELINIPHKKLELPLKPLDFQFIRVSLNNLDHLSAYMEQIQPIKMAIERCYSKFNTLCFEMDHLKQSSDNSELVPFSTSMHLMQREMKRCFSELSSLFTTLQDEIRTIRLISVNAQLRYFPRIVRDLALELHKEVTLDISTHNVKIDKIILDSLKDPLVHLIRNAIDHGIERAEVRRAAGKSEEGTITLEVTQEDKQIVFRISDDGAGINPEEVKNKALKQNLITQAELATMTLENLYELIFLPGFSTREVTTDISGRGVGLDIVRTNLLRLKGQVSVRSTPGRGTDFFLRVPLTLATERGLIISCNGQAFVLITSSIECVLLLKKQDLLSVNGNPAILVKKQPVLLYSLAELLHYDKPEKKEPFSVVVLKKDNKRIALHVDELIGEREIILKPLQEPLADTPCIIGATLTGTNQINFVLNVSELINLTCYSDIYDKEHK